MSTRVIIDDVGDATIAVRIEEEVIFEASADEFGPEGVYAIAELVSVLCENFGIPFRNDVEFTFLD